MKKILYLLIFVLLLTACATSDPPRPDPTVDDGTTVAPNDNESTVPSDNETTIAPNDNETTVPSDNETTVAAPDETTVPGQNETILPEQNTTPSSNESVTTQAQPDQTEVISSPLIVSGPDTEFPDDVDVLNPIPYKAYVYESSHVLPLISNSGFYTWYNKVPYGYNKYELVEETNAPPTHSITVNGVEYVGNYKETAIQNYYGTFGTLKRSYKFSDQNGYVNFKIDASTGELVCLIHALKYDADVPEQAVSEEEAFQIGIAFIDQQVLNAPYINEWNYRYEGKRVTDNLYAVYYQRYINEICVGPQCWVTIDLIDGNIQRFEKFSDISEMESMSGYIDFDLAKLCADEKMREVTRKYFYVTEKEIGEPEARAIRLSSNGAFCMVYEYPVYKPKSKETAYLSILVCVLNPDFQH